MEEIFPSFIKDFLATITPFYLWTLEAFPPIIAIGCGVFSFLHLRNKYKLTSLELKEKEEETKRKKDENSSL